MPEPTATSTAAALAAALAAIEASTGLQVPLVMWAALGGYWSFRWLEPMPPLQRCSALAISSLMGALLAIPAALVAVAAARHFLPWWPTLADVALLAKPIAAMLGLLCHPVIGKKAIEWGSRKADEVVK